MKVNRFIFTIMLILLLSGCAMFEKVGPASVAIHEDHEEMVTSINQKLEETAELYDTIVIACEEDILITYKVRHLNRFKMKTIEKKLTNWLEDEYPDMEIDVSSDFKIFLESYNLLQSWEDEKLTTKEAEKKLAKIIKLKNEMT